MSYEQFNNNRQQFCDLRSFHCAPEEQRQHQSRNGMKRPRGYSPPDLDYSSDPSCRHQVTKRLRRLSVNDSPGLMSNSFNNNNNHGGFSLTNKSDDEISLAEEAQIAPSALPKHSSFMQHEQNQHYQQSIQTQQQQHQSQLGHHQPVASTVAATNVPSGSRCSTASGTIYATDYQPMNSLLGNLHIMRQRQQRRRQAALHDVLQGQAHTRDHSAMVPQQQHQPQNHYHRHYGNHHSVPTTTTNAVVSGDNHSRRKTVSLRVSSNLY